MDFEWENLVNGQELTPAGLKKLGQEKDNTFRDFFIFEVAKNMIIKDEIGMPIRLFRNNANRNVHHRAKMSLTKEALAVLSARGLNPVDFVNQLMDLLNGTIREMARNSERIGAKKLISAATDYGSSTEEFCAIISCGQE